MEKTPLKTAAELLNSTTLKAEARTGERAIGLAIVAVAENLGRVAGALEMLTRKLAEKGSK